MFLMLAAGKKSIPFDASLDEESEIEEGIDDLDSAEAIGRQGRNSPYWPKIRERLIQFSSTDNVEEAIREWVDEGSPFAARGTCELCDKNPIKFHFPIKNRVTGKRLVVGSECIINYLMIGGYESAESLRKRLVAQRNILKKQERGEASPEQVEAVNKAFELEKDLRARVAAVAGGDPDFDMKEYKDSLWDVISVGQALRINSVGFQSAQDAHKACRSVLKFMEDTRKKQKGFASAGLASLISAVMRQRDPGGRLASLESLRRLLNNVFQTGLPDAVISRAWGAVEESKDSLLLQVTKRCDEGKSRLMETYKDELDLSKQYQHLHFMLMQGLLAQRKTFDSQVERVQKALDSEDFLEQIKSEGSAVAKLLNLTFYPDLGNSDGSLESAAYNIGQFLDLIGKGLVGGVVSAIESTFTVNQVRDLAGVRVALLRAADDGIIDADVMGVAAIKDFEKLVQARDPKVVDILQSEVDDIGALAKMTGNQRNFEVMSEDLGFDVEKAYKLYSKDNAFESKFCEDIFNRWKRSPLNYSLSPAQMSNFKRQMAMKGKVGEVKNSMWDALKPALTAKFR